MSEEIPEWAKRRAEALAAEPRDVRAYYDALARYIAAHERPPVDPVLIEAREIASGFNHYEPEIVLSGQLDHSVALQMTIAALRRGFQEFTFGWAITCHKSQGSQWDDVLIFDESGAFREHARNWLYTAVTRAADRVTVIV